MTETLFSPWKNREENYHENNEKTGRRSAGRSNAVYDEYLGDRFAAAMNAAMDAGSQFEDSDEAEEVAEGILAAAGFSDAEVAATVAPKGAEIRLVASGLESAIINQRFSIDGKKIGYAGAKLKGNGNNYMVFAVIQ